MNRIDRLGGSVVLALVFLGCGQQQKKAPFEKTAEASKTEIGTPMGQHSSLPFLFSNGERTLLSWVEKENDSLTSLHYAELVAGEWQAPQEVLRGVDWFVNWADFPMIAENKGNLWSHILKKTTADTYSYAIKMNVLAKGAEEWTTDVPLHTDGTPTEHGFVTVLPYQDAFFVTWLDGRYTLEDKAKKRGAMTLRAAEVAANGKISAESELDAYTCDCCQTTAVITDKGPVVLYRDRSDEEIRDISIVRQVDGKWTVPKTIHDDGWQIKGCPVNGPKAAGLDNALVAAWFTGAQGGTRVQLAFSGDSGATFDVPIRVADRNALGRVDVLLLEKEKAVVSWMEAFEDRAVVKAVAVHRNGTKGAVRIIAELDASRNTGFPQMELVGNRVYFAWTDATDGNTQVRTLAVPPAQFMP